MRGKAAFHEELRMRFFDVSQRFHKGELGCDMAADILGVSVSTFYRMRHRYEEEGEKGLVDRRIGRMTPSGKNSSWAERYNALALTHVLSEVAFRAEICSK